MKFNERDEEYELSTGRTFYAHQGILGVTPRCGDVYNGCDGISFMEREDLTPTERQEIANYMIELWRKWALTLSPQGTAP